MASGRNPIAVLVLLALLALLAGCATQPSFSGFVHGSGNEASESRELAQFSSVELAGALPVTIDVGESQSVIVRGDDNLLSHVLTEVRGETLRISTRGAIATEAGLTVEISVPSLLAVELGGAGTLDIRGVHGASFRAELPGAGSITASGTVDRLEATVSGTGSARLDRLVARDVSADVSGVGSAQVWATDSLTASVSGVGSIRYRGSPRQISTIVTGVGSVAAL